MMLEERLWRLNQASCLIQEVRDSLSKETSICECCGLKTYTSFDQYQVREHLNSALNRLEKSMDRMSTDTEKFQK